jgi:hypothetical protein
MQPTHCITDKRFAEKRIGLERCKGAYAWQRLLDAGVNVAFGTDWPVEPIDPLEGLYAAVTRKDRAGEEGEGWFPDQKLSKEKAIELYTWGAAYAEFMEDRKGRDHALQSRLHHRRREGRLPERRNRLNLADPLGAVHLPYLLSSSNILMKTELLCVCFRM